MNLEENLNKILSKYDKLQKKATSDEVINSPKDYAIISKEISEILPTVELIKKFKKVREEIKRSKSGTFFGKNVHLLAAIFYGKVS